MVDSTLQRGFAMYKSSDSSRLLEKNPRFLFVLNEKEMGPVSKMLYAHLTDIHHGYQPDPFGWCDPIK